MLDTDDEYACVCVCVCLYIYIYIYLLRARTDSTQTPAELRIWYYVFCSLQLGKDDGQITEFK